MQRRGSPWTGLGTVLAKETTDHLSSVRMRLLEALILITAVGAAYGAIGSIRETIAESPFLFLHMVTMAREPLPSFVSLLGFLVPLAAIALGFDAISGEFGRRTMSRILSQPIYRDGLLLGKFLAGLAALSISLAALWLLVIGLGILLLGLPPSTEEVVRLGAFLVATIAYGAIWLALAMTLSVVFRAPATAAMATLAIWLLFAVFWSIISPLGATLIAGAPTTDLGLPNTDYRQAELALSRLSPNTLFGETALALLHPQTRALGTVFFSQIQGALLGSPLSASQSLLLIWPQLTALVSASILLFAVAYVLFQRQEIRA